jgi:DNA-binding transcriptional ArsR family regulator
MSRRNEVRIAGIFFALGDPRRLSVLDKLRRGALSATALAEGAGVSRQAIVKHLQVLDGAGLVAHRKRGREVLYTPDARRLHEARAFLEMISAGWDRAIDRLTEMVEGRPRSTRKKRRR